MFSRYLQKFERLEQSKQDAVAKIEDRETRVFADKLFALNRNSWEQDAESVHKVEPMQLWREYTKTAKGADMEEYLDRYYSKLLNQEKDNYTFKRNQLRQFCQEREEERMKAEEQRKEQAALAEYERKA